jgi:hypothetical protein
MLATEWRDGVLHIITSRDSRPVGCIYSQTDGKYWIFEPHADMDIEWVKHFTKLSAAEAYALAYYLEEME